MDNSNINIRLDDVYDMNRSTDDQNIDIYSMIDALSADIKELKTQINNLKVCLLKGTL